MGVVWACGFTVSLPLPFMSYSFVTLSVELFQLDLYLSEQSQAPGRVTCSVRSSGRVLINRAAVPVHRALGSLPKCDTDVLFYKHIIAAAWKTVSSKCQPQLVCSLTMK